MIYIIDLCSEIKKNIFCFDNAQKELLEVPHGAMVPLLIATADNSSMMVSSHVRSSQ